MNKKVKITGCSNPNFWYTDKIGDEYLVSEKLENDFYIVRNMYLYGGEKYYGHINEKDCIDV